MAKTNRDLVALVPDVHIPDHDPAAVDWCLRQIKDRRPGTVILLGDVIDLVSLSRFPKPPEVASCLLEELEHGKEFFDKLLKACGGARVVYKSGNHEDRMQHYLWKHAPELSALESLSVPGALGINKKVEYVSNHHIIEQDVMIIHGRKFDGNVALANLRRYRMSVAQGHSHRMTIAYLCDAKGALMGSAECGTLQNKTPGYAGVTDWTLGMAWIHKGLLTVQPKEDQ